MSDTKETERDPQSAAQEDLLRAIATQVKETERMNAGSRAEALRHLAEAYAFVVAPAQPH